MRDAQGVPIPMQGPLIPARSHSLECWPLPRDGFAPKTCACPLITGDKAPLYVNYDLIRNAGEGHVMPDPFPDPDEMTREEDIVPWLHQHAEGTCVIDRAGNRFLLMAFGPMQSACVLRDRNRQMFYADIGQRLKAAKR